MPKASRDAHEDRRQSARACSAGWRKIIKVLQSFPFHLDV
jgi:hypothetical protein